jgi:tRNA-Thr(GGU) m(6)t(6)A37 methyltransferase TsaA
MKNIAMATPRAPYAFEPIGYVRSPFRERAAAPRQPGPAVDASGTIELLAGRGYEHALDGLEGWDRIWILFVFHQNVEQARGWKPHVLPPRSARKQGVFATRSPHRPNPIGLSVVTLERVDGLSVHVRGIDLLDATPVLDIKPYVAYADAHPDARAGWLEQADPIAPWEVSFGELATIQIAWLLGRGLDLEPAIVRALSLGPQPNPYRRIRKQKDDRMVLSLKEWRVDFAADARRIVVSGLRTGYRPSQLAGDPGLEVHRAFSESFP